MSAMHFRELTLLEAESQLVGRCLVDADALSLALRRLPADCWRSSQGQDLADVFNALAGRLSRGTFNGRSNEDDLAIGMPSHDKAQRDAEWWAAWLDGLWCPWTAAPQYLAGLVDSLVRFYALQDALASAYREILTDAPLELDGEFEDGLFTRLRESIARRRESRYRQQIPSQPGAVDWESVRQRAKAL